MMFTAGTSLKLLLLFSAAWLLAIGGVAIAVQLCRKRGWVERPHPNRWHKGAPAQFGGVPVWLAMLFISLSAIPFSNHLLWKLIGLASLMFVVGLVDDIVHLKPGQKLFAQLAIAGVCVALGLAWSALAHPIFNVMFSVFWIVGITNAFNLLDNMDGLSAGVGAIAAVYLALLYLHGGLPDFASLLVIAAGAASGFLVFNFSPARIFMGDAGSLFLGFLLAVSSLLEINSVGGLPTLILAPVTVLALPIFDTFFVSLTRRLRGQAISQGGTDHSSHRLVRLGLEERRAVLLLYALSAVSGALALVTRRWSAVASTGVIALWFFSLLLFGIHLFHDEDTLRVHGWHPRNPFLRQRLIRDTLVLILDPLALVLSYYLACNLIGGRVPGNGQAFLLRSLPIVVGLKVFSLWLCRAFRHSWWRGSFADIYRLGVAAIFGEALSALVLAGLFRFNAFSHSLLWWDAGVSWILLLAIRRSPAFFRHTIAVWCSQTGPHRRVFVLGTSACAEFALRFLREQHIDCAGFIDTNGGPDVHRYVFGRPVLGRVEDLPRLSKQHGISEIVLPDQEILAPGTDLPSFCRHGDLRLTRLGLYEPAVEERRQKTAASA